MPTYHNPYSPNSIIAMTLNETQMQDNAVFIWGYMYNKYGWTLNAVAGMLGNIEPESTMNPARPQNNAVNNGWYPSCPGYIGDATTPTTTWYGYGLFQVTPYMAFEGRRENPYNFGNWAYSKGYTFSHSSGGTAGQMEVQLDWLMSGAPEHPYYNDTEPTKNQAKWYQDSRSPLNAPTPAIYGKLTGSPEDCGRTFYWNLERSEATAEGNRPTLSRKWYNFLSGVTPPTPDPVPTKRKTNFIMLAYGSGLIK